ncbi:MAG: hypothetical protein KKF44_10545 [Nanoarchaeota archaeon]|nr:hypothetical protein [Nanoarchaeota archaeon]
MKEKLKANVQYNDWIGDSAADFFNGGQFFISENFNIPEEYFPIGISFYFEDKDFKCVYVIACKKSKYGASMDEIMKHSNIKAKRFDVDMSFEAFLHMVKRLQITLKNNNLKNTEIEYNTD